MMSANELTDRMLVHPRSQLAGLVGTIALFVFGLPGTFDDAEWWADRLSNTNTQVVSVSLWSAAFAVFVLFCALPTICNEFARRRNLRLDVALSATERVYEDAKATMAQCETRWRIEPANRRDIQAWRFRSIELLRDTNPSLKNRLFWFRPSSCGKQACRQLKRKIQFLERELMRLRAYSDARTFLIGAIDQR